MKIVQVTGYKLSDGRIIENEAEALRLQTELNKESMVREFVTGYSVSYPNEYGIMTNLDDEFHDFIMNHTEALRELLDKI